MARLPLPRGFEQLITFFLRGANCNTIEYDPPPELSFIFKHACSMNLFKYELARSKAFLAMGGDDRVPETLCRNVCHNITVWYRQGVEVRARNDSRRVRCGKYGWELPLGENRFGVEMAIRWSREYLNQCFLRGKPRPFKLSPHELGRLESLAAQAVIGHGDRLYRSSYPINQGKLWFGTHAVVLARFASSLGGFSGLNTGTPEFEDEDL